MSEGFSVNTLEWEALKSNLFLSSLGNCLKTHKICVFATQQIKFAILLLRRTHTYLLSI